MIFGLKCLYLCLFVCNNFFKYFYKSYNCLRVDNYIVSLVLVIEFEDVRNGNNFWFNFRDLMYYEVLIFKSSCLVFK